MDNRCWCEDDKKEISRVCEAAHNLVKTLTISNKNSQSKKSIISHIVNITLLLMLVL